MSRTYRRTDHDQDQRAARKRGRDIEKPFRCRRCKAMVGPVPSGGSHRNHCPYCLHSRHVDARVPGDRNATCGASMAPVGHFTRPNGEYVIVHACLGCGFERYNRIAADDNFELVVKLPALECRPVRMPRIEPHERTA